MINETTKVVSFLRNVVHNMESCKYQMSKMIVSFFWWFTANFKFLACYSLVFLSFLLSPSSSSSSFSSSSIRLLSWRFTRTTTTTAFLRQLPAQTQYQIHVKTALIDCHSNFKSSSWGKQVRRFMMQIMLLMQSGFGFKVEPKGFSFGHGQSMLLSSLMITTR